MFSYIDRDQSFGLYEDGQYYYKTALYDLEAKQLEEKGWDFLLSISGEHLDECIYRKEKESGGDDI